MYKKVLSLLTASVFLMSALVFVPVQGAGEIKTGPITKISQSGPVDLGVANDEKLIQMLKKQGKIVNSATPAQEYKELQTYLNKKVKATEKLNTYKGGNSKKIGTTSPGNAKTSSFLTNKNITTGLTAGTVGEAVPVPYNGAVMTDNILVLLIDFPDYPHNSMTTADTDLYYKDYTSAHYAEMMFGATGYAGPTGQKLISMRQYYEQQSGGSYTVKGSVSPWYRASKPAAFYGGNALDEAGNDTGGDLEPRALVEEALTQAAKKMDLSRFDENKDGIIDHIMVMHAGAGEEAGGGALMNNSIWSHSWGWTTPFVIPRTNGLKAGNYTIQPEDAAAGVCSHEFGHDLGLPDEYDTAYTASGEPVEYWSIMSSGSWAGKIPGTEPTGFSPYARSYFEATYGGNWISGTEVDISEINSIGKEALLDQATTKGTNNDVVKITLPNKTKFVNTPFAGSYEYFSGASNDLDSNLTLNLDLTGKTSASVDLMAWYQIEKDYDYLHFQVKEASASTWTDLEVISAMSNGWETRSFNLNAYAGKNINFRAHYVTDGGWIEASVYLDNIKVTIDGTATTFNAESDTTNPMFNIGNYTRDTGSISAPHYYLLEWRNQQGVDKSLGYIKRADGFMSYDPGLVVWYVDETYTDNFVGMHPGKGYIGVVDADQNVIRWTGSKDGGVASTRYQIHDAAFSTIKGTAMNIPYLKYGMSAVDNQLSSNPLFDDSAKYITSQIPEAGKILPNFGLKVRVTEESANRTAAKIFIFK